MELRNLKDVGDEQAQIASNPDLRREIDAGEKQLNALNIANRHFSITQDRPHSGLSIVVAEKNTGAVLRSLWAESVLGLRAQTVQHRHLFLALNRRRK